MIDINNIRECVLLGLKQPLAKEGFRLSKKGQCYKKKVPEGTFSAHLAFVDVGVRVRVTVDVAASHTEINAYRYPDDPPGFPSFGYDMRELCGVSELSWFIGDEHEAQWAIHGIKVKLLEVFVPFVESCRDKCKLIEILLRDELLKSADCLSLLDRAISALVLAKILRRDDIREIVSKLSEIHKLKCKYQHGEFLEQLNEVLTK